MENSVLGYADTLVCSVCLVRAEFEVVARHVERDRDRYRRDLKIHSDITYELLRCPVCQDVILKVHDYSCTYRSGKDQPSATSLVSVTETDEFRPLTNSLFDYLPQIVAAAYREAMAVMNISPNAYAALIGRLLEAVVDDLGAGGDDLYRKLKDLAEKGKIPEQMGLIAQRLRELRNVGAHAAQGSLPFDSVPILDNLTRSLLEYVYIIPGHLAAAERQLNELKQTRETK